LRRIQEGHVDVVGDMLGAGSTSEKPVQRPLHFCLVDEADSILIDEARTPLVIGALPTEEEKIEVECYRFSAEVARRFEEDVHFEYEHDERRVTLTAAGRQLCRQLQKPEAMDRVGMYTIYEFMERAIKVEREFILD